MNKRVRTAIVTPLIAAVAVGAMGAKAGCGTNGPPSSQGFYTGFPLAAVKGKVKPSGTAVKGNTGWVGDKPPGKQGDWQELGFVKKGPYKGDLVWRLRNR